MKLIDLRPEVLNEADTKETTSTLGEYITTKQAGAICGVSADCVRGWIAEGRLKAHHPVPGRRDNFLKRSEVIEFSKKPREITGRPDGS
jgi:excisionase family DNA binding protein